MSHDRKLKEALSKKEIQISELKNDISFKDKEFENKTYEQALSWDEQKKRLNRQVEDLNQRIRDNAEDIEYYKKLLDEKDQEIKKNAKSKNNNIELLKMEWFEKERDLLNKISQKDKEIDTVRGNYEGYQAELKSKLGLYEKELKKLTDQLQKVGDEDKNYIEGIHKDYHREIEELQSSLKKATENIEKQKNLFKNKEIELSKEVVSKNTLTQKLKSELNSKFSEVKDLKETLSKQDQDYQKKLDQQKAQIDDYKKKITKNVNILDDKIKENIFDINYYKNQLKDKEGQVDSVNSRQQEIDFQKSKLNEKENEFETYSLSKSELIIGLNRKIDEREDALSKTSIEKSLFQKEMSKLLKHKDVLQEESGNKLKDLQLKIEIKDNLIHKLSEKESEFEREMNKLMEYHQSTVTKTKFDNEDIIIDLRDQLAKKNMELYEKERNENKLQEKVSALEENMKNKIYTSDTRINELEHIVKGKDDEIKNKYVESDTLSNNMNEKQKEKDNYDDEIRQLNSELLQKGLEITNLLENEKKLKQDLESVREKAEVEIKNNNLNERENISNLKQQIYVKDTEISDLKKKEIIISKEISEKQMEAQEKIEDLETEVIDLREMETIFDKTVTKKEKQEEKVKDLEKQLDDNKNRRDQKVFDAENNKKNGETVKYLEKQILDMEFEKDATTREKDRLVLQIQNLQREVNYLTENQKGLDFDKNIQARELRDENRRHLDKIADLENKALNDETEIKIIKDKLQVKTKEVERYKNENWQKDLKLAGDIKNEDHSEKVEELSAIVKNLTEENKQLILENEKNQQEAKKILDENIKRREASEQTNSAVIGQIKGELRKAEEGKAKFEEENRQLKIKLDDQINQINELGMTERKLMLALKEKNKELGNRKGNYNSKESSIMGTKNDLSSKRDNQYEKRASFRDTDTEFSRQKRAVEDDYDRLLKKDRKTRDDVSVRDNDSVARSRKNIDKKKKDTKEQGLFEGLGNILMGGLTNAPPPKKDDRRGSQRTIGGDNKSYRDTSTRKSDSDRRKAYN